MDEGDQSATPVSPHDVSAVRLRRSPLEREDGSRPALQRALQHAIDRAAAPGRTLAVESGRFVITGPLFGSSIISSA